MKVRTDKSFRPIHIILENEKEVNAVERALRSLKEHINYLFEYGRLNDNPSAAIMNSEHKEIVNELLTKMKQEDR